jgi:hypothetical protein
MVRMRGQFIIVTAGRKIHREELEQDKAAANAQGDGFSARGCAKLAQDRGDVEFCGVIGDVEAGGDLFVTQAGSQHLQDFAFAAG